MCGCAAVVLCAAMSQMWVRHTEMLGAEDGQHGIVVVVLILSSTIVVVLVLGAMVVAKVVALGVLSVVALQ